jgi:hypothetical protein
LIGYKHEFDSDGALNRTKKGTRLLKPSNSLKNFEKICFVFRKNSKAAHVPMAGGSTHTQRESPFGADTFPINPAENMALLEKKTINNHETLRN